MLRNDGKLIEVQSHPYFIDEYYTNWENLSLHDKYIYILNWIDNDEYFPDLGWLYNNTQDEQTKYAVKYIIKNVQNEEEISNIVNFFVLCNTQLNQEFLRIRLGGEYSSVGEEGHLYCRVSSYNFDWLPLIKDLLYKNRDIRYITIETDIQSTKGKKYFMYTTDRNEKIKAMDVDVFLYDMKRGFIESFVKETPEWENFKRMNRRFVYSYTKKMQEEWVSKNFDV